MTEGLHAEATAHLPPFVTMPGQTDVLFVAMVIFLILAVLGIGLLYFKLHSLPEQMAHRGQKLQFEIVAVLGLLSLFTHNHLFWIAGLLLALVPLPDLSTPLGSMAQSLGRIAGNREGLSDPERPGDAAAQAGPAATPEPKPHGKDEV
jgi:hypothetical protein